MSEHTPGEWRILRTGEPRDELQDAKIEVVVDNPQWPSLPFIVCEINNWRNTPTKGFGGCGAEPMANARLIAAAPALLAACKSVVGM